MNTLYRPPDQIIQPYNFGDPEQRTCLWLFNLPPLLPVKIVKPNFKITPNGHKTYFSDNVNPVKNRAEIRSVTFSGIADAMALQWTEFVKSDKK